MPELTSLIINLSDRNLLLRQKLFFYLGSIQSYQILSVYKNKFVWLLNRHQVLHHRQPSNSQCTNSFEDSKLQIVEDSSFLGSLRVWVLLLIYQKFKVIQIQISWSQSAIQFLRWWTFWTAHQADYNFLFQHLNPMFL